MPDVMLLGGSAYPLASLRMNNGPLMEHGLASMLSDLSAQPAGQIGVTNTSESLLDAESAAIRQGRTARLQPYSAYREYAGLPRASRFDEVSTNPAVVNRLRELYQSPDDIDFYVGLSLEDPMPNSPVPPLMLRMVAVDAFSQALTNPLLSPHVYKPDTFSSVGLRAIDDTTSLARLLARNGSGRLPDRPITFTRPDWQYRRR